VRGVRRRRRRQCSLRHLEHTASWRKPPGEPRCPERIQIGLARQAHIQRLKPLAARSSSGGASLPRFWAYAICARSTSSRARSRSSSGPAWAAANSPSAVSGAPARCLAWAAASARCARRAGSSVNPTARSKNAAAAARPPRRCARPADRSSSAATSSSGPEVACARCQARRSGSTSGSVTSASAACTFWRWLSGAARYTAERTSGWRNTTRPPSSSNPAVPAWPPASILSPSRLAARHTSAGSPTGSAAATSNSNRVSSGRLSTPAHPAATGSPNQQLPRVSIP
jgi:hypothetical protein